MGYLAHTITPNGISVDTQNIEAISQWSLPTSLKVLRSFLGFIGYYRKFVKGYGVLTAPLTDMLKREVFIWTDKSREVFVKLKEALMSPSVLQMPNFDNKIIIECYACGVGLGSVLMQEGHPIAYLSQRLKGKALLLSTYKKEMMAILLTIKKWRHYLLGRIFIIKTDQKRLKYLLDQRFKGNLNIPGCAS